MTQNSRIPSPLISFIPIVVLVISLFISIKIFGSDSLSGPNQICLLMSTALCAALSIAFFKQKWQDFEHAIVNNIAGVSSAIVILLIIGAMSAAWMLSGVVPMMIYNGIKLINPDYFLVSTCVICALVSVMTGSSWTTIATIGIALLGIGKALGFDEGWIAGAIISGSYFGDKISPLSDTTVLASSVTDTPLLTHIRYMMITTVPSFVITLVIFIIAGFMHHTTGTVDVGQYLSLFDNKFNLTSWLLIVPIITGLLIAKKVPAIITLFISTVLALVFVVIFQSNIIHEIAVDGLGNVSSVISGCMKMLYGSTSIDMGDADVTSLVATRGMSGMLNTIWLIICAMCFGGAMTASGMLGSIMSVFLRSTHKRIGLVTSTVGSGLFFNLTTSDQYMSLILTGNMFKDIYKSNGYESRLLSRTSEDSITVTSALIPWNTCGMTQATILSVPTLTYFPYSFFNYISPLMSIFVALIGYKIYKKVVR